MRRGDGNASTLLSMADRERLLHRISCSIGCKAHQPVLETSLDKLSIRSSQTVFSPHNPMSPVCRLFRRVKILQFAGQLLPQSRGCLAVKLWLQGSWVRLGAAIIYSNS